MSENTEKVTWFTDKEPVKDYAYSFVLVGDTQMITMFDAGTNWAWKADYVAPEGTRGKNIVKGLYRWIIDNAEEKKIAHVFGLGDMTELVSNEAEWAVVDEAVHQLDGIVPYTVVRGNHDHPDNFVNTFNREPYASTLTESYEKTPLRNAYKTFSVCGIDYLVLLLDYDPKDEVLEWADGILAKYPDHRVIVTTHSYLDLDGSLMTVEKNNSFSTKLKNTGTEIWNKLLRKHKNVFMVCCGHHAWHMACSRIMGDNGNNVINISLDAESMDLHIEPPSAIVIVLYFSNDGKYIDVEFVSTYRKAFYNPDYQFRIEI